MSRIGRNEPCPCGSGLKYKRCCLQKREKGKSASPMHRLKISLMDEIAKIQSAASRKEEVVRELGVFVFCTTPEGNAWLLEVTESDAVQLAAEGEPLAVPVDENPETIEINWSHTFRIRDRRFYLTSYTDQRETCLETIPCKRIHAAIKRIRKKFSRDQLSQVHINAPAAE